MISTEFAYGPNLKSSATQIFEALIKLILHNPDAVSIKIHGAGNIQVTIDGIQFNLREILTHCQFEFLEFNQHDSDVYINRFSDAPKVDSAKGNPKYKDLYQAELVALYRYTASDFEGMNELLHGLEKPYEYGRNISINLKNIAFASSGLQKTRREYCDKGDPKKNTYRADVCSAAEFEARKQFIGKNDWIRQAGFMSTSTSSYPSRCGYSKSELKKSSLTVKNNPGAYIEDISFVPGEQEVLISPGTKLKWTSYDKSNNRFGCEVVNPLVDVHEINNRFAPLLKFLTEALEKYNVKTDFVTEHNLKLMGQASNAKLKTAKEIEQHLASHPLNESRIQRELEQEKQKAKPAKQSAAEKAKEAAQLENTKANLKGINTLINVAYFASSALIVLSGAASLAALFTLFQSWQLGALASLTLSGSTMISGSTILSSAAGLLSATAGALMGSSILTRKRANYIESQLKLSNQIPHYGVYNSLQPKLAAVMEGQHYDHVNAYNHGQDIYYNQQHNLIYSRMQQLVSFTNHDAWGPGYYYGRKAVKATV